MVEVLADFSSARPSLDWVLSSGPKLAPREFSISSSPLAHPGHVHLTLAVVSWVTPYKRRRRGLCSTWLAGLRPGVAVPVRIKPGALRLPADPATPIICVGPGTGVAPMRAFIHHRAAQRAAGGGAWRKEGEGGGVPPAEGPGSGPSFHLQGHRSKRAQARATSPQAPRSSRSQFAGPACSSSAAEAPPRTGCTPRSGRN